MNTDLRNAEDEGREIRIEGFWFLPPSDDNVEPHRVAGVLTFATAESAKLDLFALLDDASVGFREIPVI